MKLGIKGHSMRGTEVIKLLESLGGVNYYLLTGDNDNKFYYICDKYKDIGNSYIGPDEIKGYEIFSLEDFLEKFPYKVGDKVTLDNKLCYITWMCWECDNIYYQVQGIDLMFTKKITANELKPYKGKNTNMNIEYDLAKYSYEIKDGKLVIGEKKPDLLQQLKNYFVNTPREIIEKEWHEYDKYNEIEPTVNEYLEYVNKIKLIK